VVRSGVARHDQDRQGAGVVGCGTVVLVGVRRAGAASGPARQGVVMAWSGLIRLGWIRIARQWCGMDRYGPIEERTRSSLLFQAGKPHPIYGPGNSTTRIAFVSVSKFAHNVSEEFFAGFKTSAETVIFIPQEIALGERRLF